jgi:hypothetical protein
MKRFLQFCNEAKTKAVCTSLKKLALMVFLSKEGNTGLESLNLYKGYIGI